MSATIKYRLSDYALWITSAFAFLASYLFIWKPGTAVNFIDGDTEYYYYYLQSTFVDSQFIHYDWLTDPNGLHHHPVGVSLLLLPFFLLSLFFARLFGFAADGLSTPFQFSISLAAIVYSLMGLIYLKKLLREQGVGDRIAALTILLVFFGTNLFHYTVMESAMSHAYSFCFVSIFLYYSHSYVVKRQNKDLLAAALALGVILLLRPNNILILFSLFGWFNSRKSCLDFFRELLRKRAFYFSVVLLLLICLFQLLTWYTKENSLFSNRYAGFGFHWFQPHLIEMLFGFNAGLFIYTPICFIFLLGFIPLYYQNRFSFKALALFFGLFFYFLSCYSAYTYFDGLGIRVLIDFYPLFALLGAKWLTVASRRQWSFASLLLLSGAFTLVSLIYSYQEHNGILLRAGMNYNKWKYVFLKTSPAYRDCLGGSNDLPPYAAKEPPAALEKQVPMDQPFNYAQKDFGLLVAFDSIGFRSNQVQLKINCARTELFQNASKNAMICATLEDKLQNKGKSYSQFKLNETPAADCCDEKEYAYTCTMHGDFRPNDRLSVYVWNMDRQPFLINKFSVQVYNYNYQIN